VPSAAAPPLPIRDSDQNQPSQLANIIYGSINSLNATSRDPAQWDTVSRSLRALRAALDA